MSTTTVFIERAWNTWTSERPAEMVYLPLGVRLTPMAYAASSNSVSDFPAGSGVRLEERDIDASRVALTLSHSGTVLDWRYAKSDPFTLCGCWQARTVGEWGLRFWVILCLQSDACDEWLYDTETGEVHIRIGHRYLVLVCSDTPLLATFHDSKAVLEAELVERGYFYLGSRGERGRVAALRFNLEATAGCRFALAQADDLDLARTRAHAALVDTTEKQASRLEGKALAAVRDVIAWNTVWDRINQRPYTALSRHWNTHKFGGFGVWLDDVFYHALLAGLFDMQLARDNLAAVFAGRTPQGNLPCLLTGNDAWVDRSQPPIGAFIVWLLYLRSGARDLLEWAYPALLANHEWWWRERDGNGDGLLEYGTSRVGQGLYKGIALGARNESSMDNSPVHDQAVLDPSSGTLNCADVGLNSLVVLDGEMLAAMAGILGDYAAAARLGERSQRLAARIRDDLWDDARGVFANRLWSGEFVNSLAPTSFFPLLAGAASPRQAEIMIADYLQNPAEFGGEWLLPAVSRSDPAFSDNVYWRGRIWPPLHFLVYHGLCRSGHETVAAELAANGYRLFSRAWAERCCPENYNAVTGEALDQPDTDSFYGWGALLPYLDVAEALSIDPWDGWSLNNAPGDVRVGPVNTPAGRATVMRRAGVLSLEIDGRMRLCTNIRGRLTQLEITRAYVSLITPASVRAGEWIELPGVVTGDLAILRLQQGEDLPVHSAGEHGVRVEIPPGVKGKTRLCCYLKAA